MYEPKTLLLDIENSPSLGHFFGKIYETNILDIKEQSYILSVAYQWYGEDKVHVSALPDFKGYKTDKSNDYYLMQVVWKLLDEADFVVAQNGISFDLRHINLRFAFHRMTPPSPYQVIDTLRELRRTFNLPSNKLDFVCKYFEIGGKLPNTGKDLWLGCMEGDPKAWKEMKRYNAHDVLLLNKLYTLLMPWGKRPNANFLTGVMVCSVPNCGGTRFEKRGERVGGLGFKYQRLLCMKCGKWNRGPNIPLESKIQFRPL